MAKLVYKGKVNGYDVFYRDSCINYYVNGGMRMNLMDVVTATGKKFKFQCLFSNSLQEALESDKQHLDKDEVDEVIIKEKGKPTLKYNSKTLKKEKDTVEGRRAKMFLDTASKMYNDIREEIFKELRDNPKGKKLENLVVTDEQIKEEVSDAFNTDANAYGLNLYRNDAKGFTKFFSKMDRKKKKEMLNMIFSCDYDNKEVIDWLNKNEMDLLREAGFNP